MKRRPWGRLALVTGVLLALAAGAAVLAGPRLVDWQAERPRVAFVLSALTGLDIEIGGTLDLSLLPAPRLSASGVRIAGAGGRGAMTVERLDARVRVMPLLIGRLDLSGLRLYRPVLRLGDVAVPERLAPDLLPAALSDVLVEDGRVEFAAMTGGRDAVDIPVGTIETHPETGLARLTGEVRVGGLPGSLTLEATVRGRAREVPVRASLQFADADAAAKFSGALAHDGVRGRISGEAALAAAEGQPVPLAFAATVAPGQGGHVLREMEASVGGQVLRGEARMIGGPAPGLTLALSARRFDARPLGRASKGMARLVSGMDTGVPISLAIEADRVILPRGTVRDMDVRAQIRDGLILLSRGHAVLPGDARLGLSGRIVPDGDRLAFSGDGDLQILRLRETLAWAGIALPDAAGDRLRTFTGRFSLERRPGETRVHAVSGQLDGVPVAGEGHRVRDADGCRMEARLSLTVLPLHAYGLGEWPGTAEAWAAPLRTCPLELDVAAAEVRLGAVSLSGVDARLAVAGTAVRAELAVAALPSGGRLSGTAGAADGRLRTVTGRLETPDLADDLAGTGFAVPDWLGPDVPASLDVALDAEGALSLSGTVAGAALDAVGQMADGRVSALSATLDGLVGGQVRQVLDAADLGALTPLMPDASGRPVSASAAWDAEGRLDLRLSGAGIGLTVAGEGGVGAGQQRLALERADVLAQAEDGTWQLGGVLTRGDGAMRLGQARLVFGASEVTGSATLAEGELGIVLDGGTVQETDARALLGHLPKLLAGVERLPYAALHLEGAIGRLTLAGMALRTVTLDADLTGRALTLSRLDAEAGAGGQLAFSGGLVPGGTGEEPVARIALNIAGVPLDGILARLTPLDLHAEGDLSGEVSGILTETGGLSEPTGELALVAGAGRLDGLGALPPIASEFQQDGGLVFDRLSGEISLAGARLLLRDIVAERAGATARMTALLVPRTGALRGAVEVRSASGMSLRAPLDPAAP
ncbi:AsmA family protein [Futiania mangrovi]|uniref:AsmA family protein n=1 Tax=Futiania mangrovi TaxID=2959716 RepID=A0A9J6P8P2_9PROT|nr:AsmA family protein [Futiania mangrovii]MCP1334973.1 AsmA family protein [Futiania mangrovii]